ncbi:MAG: CvpA family protein [Desulfobacteraceae bacterium]|nr:MAG: CvpA family protein [Desulfobacteraceae bacterium]
MNIFDIAIIIIVSFCLIRGLFKGLIREVAGIIGVIAGFYGAYTYYKLAGPYLAEWIQAAAYQNLVAFCGLFCLIVVGVSLVSVIIRKLLKVVFLGWVDFLFGMIFGAAKGVLIVSVIFIIITTFVPNNSRLLAGSTFSPYVAEISRTVMLFVSKNFRTDFLSELERIKTIWSH